MPQVKLFVTVLLLVVGVVLAGCNTDEKELSTEEGYVLDVDDDEFLVAKDMSAEEFSEVEDKLVSVDPARDFEVDDVGLIYISYDDGNIEKGDRVKVWVDGVNDSYPQQAKAEKVSIQN